MNKKIIFIDADGTLVDYELKLPDSAASAIREARKNGHRVYICTGRSKAEMYPYIWEIGLDSYQDYLDAVKEFPDLQPGTWGGKDEKALFGDFGVKGITKAHAIDVLLKHLGADIRNTIAFGDAKVDIPMLEYCNIGVAMGNGGEEIRAMADYVTDSVEKDGLYKAFVHLGLCKEGFEKGVCYHKE